MNILAIIPARGGSKGIKKKNIRPFAGKPLIAHTIAMAKKSRYITRTVVSTDDTEIAWIAKKYGAEVPFLRPAELAGDKSPVVPAILHMLERLKKEEGYSPDYIVLLQTTSPLRRADDIDGALDLLFRRRASAVVSVCATEQLLYTKDAKDRLALRSDASFLSSTNRQELPQTYKLDGSMVYGVKTTIFKKHKSFLPPNVIAYVIPRWRAVDLDEPQDVVVGEMIYKNQKAIQKKIDSFR